MSAAPRQNSEQHARPCRRTRPRCASPCGVRAPKAPCRVPMQPLAERGVHDEAALVGKTSCRRRRSLARRRRARWPRTRDPQRPGVLDVVRLVEDELVRMPEVRPGAAPPRRAVTRAGASHRHRRAAPGGHEDVLRAVERWAVEHLSGSGPVRVARVGRGLQGSRRGIQITGRLTATSLWGGGGTVPCAASAAADIREDRSATGP